MMACDVHLSRSRSPAFARPRGGLRPTTRFCLLCLLGRDSRVGVAPSFSDRAAVLCSSVSLDEDVCDCEQAWSENLVSDLRKVAVFGTTLLYMHRMA